VNLKSAPMKCTLTLLTALLLAPPAALHAGRALPEAPRFGELRAGFFQALGDSGAMTFKDWN
jgi:hypothetical protein